MVGWYVLRGVAYVHGWVELVVRYKGAMQCGLWGICYKVEEDAYSTRVREQCVESKKC